MISPQAWGTMLISKHHYALELAKRGNQVYFLNPPDNYNWNLKGKNKRIKIRPSSLHPDLYLIDQRLYFPYRIKFHARNLYNLLIKKQIADILKVIAKPVDMIWSFDLGNLFPLNFFEPGIYKVFHPVDEPRDHQAIKAATKSDIIFSVTQEILDKYKGFSTMKYFINHGLAEEFADCSHEVYPVKEKVQVGMAGNLLRTDLDRYTLLRIVRENPGVDFHFFGSYRSVDSNISGKADAETERFLKDLKSFSNVKLHGTVKTKELAAFLNRMDMLLICYDIERDQSKGTNYHKVMEYLSTGKVIVSNNITTYKDQPVLIRMPVERTTNESLPDLFKDTLLHLDQWNAPQFSDLRISFARMNTYSRQLSEIEMLIDSQENKTH